MDPHLSSTPTPEPHGHMLPYYRRHNFYLIAIICKKNQTKIIYLRGRSTAHKTWSFLPIPYTWSHVTDLPTSKNKSPQNTSKTLLKSFLKHKKQKKNFRFFSPHTLYMDPHLSSTPTPEPLNHMPSYYRRHNYYLIAIICKKN
jgi:hypothetical protein